MHHLAGLQQALQRALGPHASHCKVALSTATCIGTPCITLQGCSEHCNMHQDLMHHPAGMHQALQHGLGPHAPPCRDALCCNKHCNPMHHPAGLHQALQHAPGPHASPCRDALCCNMCWDPMQHPAGMHQALQHGTSCIALQGCSVLQRALGPHEASCRDAPSIATCTRTPCITLQGCSVLQ